MLICWGTAQAQANVSYQRKQASLSKSPSAGQHMLQLYLHFRVGLQQDCTADMSRADQQLVAMAAKCSVTKTQHVSGLIDSVRRSTNAAHQLCTGRVGCTTDAMHKQTVAG